MVDDVNDLRFYMDETSAPYSDKDNPFKRTKEDDEFDEMIIEKYKLITKEMENSAIEWKEIKTTPKFPTVESEVVFSSPKGGSYVILSPEIICCGKEFSVEV